MYIFCALLFAVAVMGMTCLLIRYALLPMYPSSAGKGLIAIAGIASFLTVILLFSCLALPKKVDGMVTGAFVQVETWYNTANPGADNQVLDKTHLLQLTDNMHAVCSFLDNNQKMSGLVQLIGVRICLGGMERFADNLEGHLAQFENRNRPFTLHNILVDMQEQAQKRVRVIACTIEVVVFVLSLLLLCGVWMAHFVIRKGLLKSSAVTFGSGAV